MTQGTPGQRACWRLCAARPLPFPCTPQSRKIVNHPSCHLQCPLQIGFSYFKSAKVLSLRLLSPPVGLTNSTRPPPMYLGNSGTSTTVLTIVLATTVSADEIYTDFATRSIGDVRATPRRLVGPFHSINQQLEKTYMGQTQLPISQTRPSHRASPCGISRYCRARRSRQGGPGKEVLNLTL